MLLRDAKKLVGNIATLDLVNGSVVTAKVTDLLEMFVTPSVIEGGDDRVEKCPPTLVCKDPIEFRVEMVAPNPQAPPSAANQPRPQLVPVPYGAPMYDVRELKIDVTHILDSLGTPKQLEDAYNQTVTGIVTASAGALG